MAVVDSSAHLLSLKVMRVSRPEVASAWQPFFSSSPHLSAHASASIISLQGNSPLPGHPKTLRDLTHASDILTLPSSFGAIYLGQTFTSCLCVNNEAPFSVDSIRIRIEMQTITAKDILYRNSESTETSLATGDTIECIVHHEVKELGQHVLACAVTYRLPPNVRPIPGASETPGDLALQTFRKYYKFMVTNPLALKTKVHPVRSPTALLMPTEREKLFFEVHIQNVTQETMQFEHLSFESMDEWQVQDPNATDGDQSHFSAPITLLNPQDIRQYIFVLSPTHTFPLRPLAVHAPGSILPLGRLNINWRSSYGEPGRLLTSTLCHRIPLINPGPPSIAASHPSQHPVSALPPHLKREKSVPSCPQSPNPQSRPGTPPIRRPQSPATQLDPLPSTARSTSNIDAHLTLRKTPPFSVRVEEPFTLTFTLHINTTSQSISTPNPSLLFAIQHILPTSPPTTVPAVTHPTRLSTLSITGERTQGTGSGRNTPRTIISPTSSISHQTHLSQSMTSQATVTQVQSTDFIGSRTSLSVLSSGFSTPTATSSRCTPGGAGVSGVFNYTLARQKLLVASPRQHAFNKDSYATHDDVLNRGVDGGLLIEEEDGIDMIYPPPYPLHSSKGKSFGASGVVVPFGASSFTLPPLTLAPQVIPLHPSSTTTPVFHPSHPSISTVSSTDSGTLEKEEPIRQQLYASHDFELTYVPLRTGFHAVGGVRVLYLGEGDGGSETKRITSTKLEIQIGTKELGEKRGAEIVREYDAVAELVVSP